METKYDLKDGSTLVGNIMPNFVKGSFVKECIRHHAEAMFSILREIHKKKTGKEFNEIEERSIMIEMITKAGVEFSSCVHNHPCPKCINEILCNDYKKKKQICLLKDVKLCPEQIASIFHRGEELGYSSSQIRFEGIPTGYKAEELPKFAYIDDDDNVISVEGENFSDGQIKAFISQAHVLIARILEKDGHWHSFVQTFKGLKGKEPGKFGSQPHLHYVSDKFYNLSFDDLIGMLRNGNYPNGSVHIPIVGYRLKDKSGNNE